MQTFVYVFGYILYIERFLYDLRFAKSKFDEEILSFSSRLDVNNDALGRIHAFDLTYNGIRPVFRSASG